MSSYTVTSEMNLVNEPQEVQVNLRPPALTNGLTGKRAFAPEIEYSDISDYEELTIDVSDTESQFSDIPEPLGERFVSEDCTQTLKIRRRFETRGSLSENVGDRACNKCIQFNTLKVPRQTHEGIRVIFLDLYETLNHTKVYEYLFNSTTDPVENQKLDDTFFKWIRTARQIKNQALTISKIGGWTQSRP